MDFEERQVKEVLAPYETQLAEAALGALADWKAIQKTVFLDNLRTRANVIWERFITRAKKSLDAKPNVQIIEKNQTALFVFDNRVALRFKFADKNGISRNFPTQLALDFNDPQVDIIGIPDVIRTDFVYVLNSLKSDIEKLMIVKRNGKNIEWAYSIGTSLATVYPIPTSTPALPPVEDTVRVRIDKANELLKKKENQQ